MRQLFSTFLFLSEMYLYLLCIGEGAVQHSAPQLAHLHPEIKVFSAIMCLRSYSGNVPTHFMWFCNSQTVQRRQKETNVQKRKLNIEARLRIYQGEICKKGSWYSSTCMCMFVVFVSMQSGLFFLLPSAAVNLLQMDGYECENRQVYR